MPTRPALQRLSAQFDQLVERLTSPKRKVMLTIWGDETARTAHFIRFPADQVAVVEFDVHRINWMMRDDAKNSGRA
jgi:hypothetical protein